MALPKLLIFYFVRFLFLKINVAFQEFRIFVKAYLRKYLKVRNMDNISGVLLFVTSLKATELIYHETALEITTYVCTYDKISSVL